MNMAADLARRAARNRWLDRPAYHENDLTLTHGRLHQLAARAATVLADAGARPGTRVLLALPDGIAWVTAFLATARLGAVAVLANPHLAAGDHAHIVRDARPRLALAPTALAPRFTALAHLTGAQLLDRAAAQPPAPPAENDPAHTLYIQYTSGTTGAPKGVIHRHRDPAHYYSGAGAQLLDIGESDVNLSVSKLFFAYGLGNSLAFPLYSGGSAVLLPGPPRPAAIADLAARHHVTHLHAVPSAYAALTAHSDPAAFRALRAAVSAGERLSPALAARVSAHLDAPVLDQLGSTEAGHAFASNSLTRHTPGTVGAPAPGFELQLRDRDLKPVADGTEGELWVRGPTVMPRYLNRPEETARTLIDGWLATRDRAVRNPDGTYTHHGRTDDLEMVGGITISPTEVEEVLAAHPSVRDVAVASLPNTEGATKLRAFVVPHHLEHTSGLEAELTALARARLAPFKVPRSVQFVDSLPRTATGKLQRFLIRTAPAR
ncbi:AMP-binding protein [Streptomyces sp. MNP-20]|uniref:AMP-binding protein n=1 Tax=Streptomyces sp. MNP-20 TaxID=2721165 RepID=UPI00155634CA|nr:AMP-binding protein [Streptomyces sp. MNP-20]